MRVNVKKTLNAWFDGKPFGKSGDSIWTDGNDIYSYNTCLLAQNVNRLVFNVTKYSATTSTQQSSLRSELNGMSYNTIDHVPRNTTAVDLLSMIAGM